MADSFEYKVVLIVAIFLALSVFMLNLLAYDGKIFENQGTTGKIGTFVNVPQAFDFTTLENQTIVSQDYKNITSGETFFYLTYQTTNDTKISLQWIISSFGYYTNQINPYHRHIAGFWIWSWEVYEQMSPLPITKDWIVANNVNNVTTLSIRCTQNDIPPIALQFTYDNETYPNINEAMLDGHLCVWMGFLGNATVQNINSYNFWTFIGGLLSFNNQVSGLPYEINTIYGFVIWAGIIICVAYVIKVLKPMG